ncbi:LysR substrate-binding domain-containing protein [Gordonia sihwensis]|uniref:LysR substrate-binding domain-containing protein n=1 Tax=Gordonia TaxID=2053 RepID=UPI002416870C|nr:LysR substrate-binding domain-containing protein [Gordonia sihwensis]WFN92169.1 LysR substrate-binding domain-containing protein [Gordonia sihwensis]
MELRHLRYYVAVAEECHFGRAAQRLHIAQPPLSQQIKQLEADLGVVLLNRSTRKVELTEAGRRYLDRAKEILASVDAAAQEANRVAVGEVGRVAIGFTGSATYHMLPAIARTLRVELPDIELDLQGEMLTPRQAAALHDGTIDLGFLRPPVHDRLLRYEVVTTEPMIAVIPRAHRLAEEDSIEIADLADEVFVTYAGFSRSVVFEVVVDACQRAGFTPTIRHEVGETAALVSFVAAGLGVALVPQSVQHMQITGAVYVPLHGEVPTVELAMAMRSEPPSPHLERVLTCLREALPQIGAGTLS